MRWLRAFLWSGCDESMKKATNKLFNSNQNNNNKPIIYSSHIAKTLITDIRKISTEKIMYFFTIISANKMHSVYAIKIFIICNLLSKSVLNLIESHTTIYRNLIRTFWTIFFCSFKYTLKIEVWTPKPTFTIVEWHWGLHLISFIHLLIMTFLSFYLIFLLIFKK